MPELDPNELIAEAEAEEQDNEPNAEDAGGDGDGQSAPDAGGEPAPDPEPEPKAPEQVATPEPHKTAEPPKEEIDLDQYKLEDIPDDYEPKSWKEALQLAEERAYKRIKGEDAQQAKTQADADAAKDEAIKEIQEGYDRELAYLEGEGRLPKGEDGLKRQEEVWQFMNTENARREKAGSKFFINSFEDALDKLEAREMKAQAKEREDKEAEARKARGAMVGGSTGAKVPASSAQGLRKGMTMDDVLEQEGY